MTACDAIEEGARPAAQIEDELAGEIDEVEANVLATLRIEGDTRIYFVDASTSVAMVEVGSGEDSVVAGLVDDGFTAAEIYETLAPEGRAAPAALIDHPGAHRARAFDLSAAPRPAKDAGYGGVASTCYSFTAASWVSFIETSAHPGFDHYAHQTNSTTGEVWWQSDASQASYRATLCPTAIHGANFVDDYVMLHVQKRQTSPLGAWTVVATSIPIRLEQRGWIYDLDNTANFQWRTKVSSVDVGTICNPDIPWICSSGSDEFHHAHMWSD
ncbi:hypothetical protein [Nannocystis exedens]|nr:hypothetical protein [Nannocystis exedens]